MTISDLLQLLTIYSLDLRVVVYGYKDGYDDRPGLGLELDPDDVARCSV